MNAQGRAWPRSLKKSPSFWCSLKRSPWLLVELWCGWDSKQSLLEGWRMQYKIFTSVPFVARERWQHSGKSMICSLLPSNEFQVNFTPTISYSTLQRLHAAPIFHRQHDSEPFFSPFHFLHTFFLSLILPPTAISFMLLTYQYIVNFCSRFWAIWHHPHATTRGIQTIFQLFIFFHSFQPNTFIMETVTLIQESYQCSRSISSLQNRLPFDQLNREQFSDSQQNMPTTRSNHGLNLAQTPSSIINNELVAKRKYLTLFVRLVHKINKTDISSLVIFVASTESVNE